MTITKMTKTAMRDGEPKFAQLSWMAGDVQSHRPDWTKDQCREWLAQNQGYIRDRLCELGNEVIATLVEIDDYGVENDR